MVHGPQDREILQPLRKGFLGMKALPYLVDNPPPEIPSSCLQDVLPVCPLEGCLPSWGCLPWDIAMGLGDKGRRHRNPGEAKRVAPNAGLAPCRAHAHSSAEPSGYTSLVQGVVLHLRHLHAGPCCCSCCCHCPTPRPCNEMSVSPLTSPSNLGNMAEPSPMVLHWGKGAFEQEKQWRAPPATPQHPPDPSDQQCPPSNLQRSQHTLSGPILNPSMPLLAFIF